MPDIPPEYLRYGAIALVVVGVLWALSKLTAKKETPGYIVQRRCKACGWTGGASKFNAKCPKCSQPL